MSFQAHLHEFSGVEADRLSTHSSVAIKDGKDEVVIYGYVGGATGGGTRTEQVARIRHVLDQAYAALDAIDPAKGDQDRYTAAAKPFEAADPTTEPPSDPADTALAKHVAADEADGGHGMDRPVMGLTVEEMHDSSHTYRDFVAATVDQPALTHTRADHVPVVTDVLPEDDLAYHLLAPADRLGHGATEVPDGVNVVHFDDHDQHAAAEVGHVHGPDGRPVR